MKYYLIVGEASGDLHASRLMRSLKKIDEFAEFRFFGGDFLLGYDHLDEGPMKAQMREHEEAIMKLLELER